MKPGEKCCSDNRRTCQGLSSRRDSDDDSTDEVEEKQEVRPEKVTAPEARGGPFGRKFFAIEISASLNFRKNLRPKEPKSSSSLGLVIPSSKNFALARSLLN